VKAHTTYEALINDCIAYRSYCDLPTELKKIQIIELSKKAPYKLNDKNAHQVMEWIIEREDEEEEEEDTFDYDNSCDCCVAGWDKPNEFGWCNCECSKCGELLRDCKYTCRDKLKESDEEKEEITHNL
jgi:hypothetical protein